MDFLFQVILSSLKIPQVQEEVQEMVRCRVKGGRAREKDDICRHPRVQLVTSCFCSGEDDTGCTRLFTLGERSYLHFSYP